LDSKAIKFLARGQFEQHLNTIQAKGGYDYVIVDSAPVGLTSETALMAKAIRNVLLVVRLGISDRPMVQETVEQLIRHDSEIIGLAVNGAEQRLEGYGYKQSSSRVDA
jgi:Mrp family chromosome partitioning ATPase